VIRIKIKNTNSKDFKWNKKYYVVETKTAYGNDFSLHSVYTIKPEAYKVRNSLNKRKSRNDLRTFQRARLRHRTLKTYEAERVQYP